MIVKVQQSLYPSDEGYKSILIYDKDRKNTYETSDIEEVEAVLSVIGSKEKAYFEAKIIDGKFVLFDEVEEEF